MKLLKWLLPLALICLLASWVSHNLRPVKSLYSRAAPGGNRELSEPKKTDARVRLLEKARAALAYARAHRFNTHTGFLVDMQLPSGQKRFFVYDFDKDTIQMSGLVTHGNCFQPWLEGRQYSNTVGSGCTSLGRYKVSSSYTGKWGYSYKLHGLDSSNNNAFERTVVLHSHSCVPEEETTEEICQSNGCTTVSPGFLDRLKPLLNSSPRPVLLWIYE